MTLPRQVEYVVAELADGSEPGHPMWLIHEETRGYGLDHFQMLLARRHEMLSTNTWSYRSRILAVDPTTGEPTIEEWVRKNLPRGWRWRSNSDGYGYLDSPTGVVTTEPVDHYAAIKIAREAAG